jgi:hypothetical protein
MTWIVRAPTWQETTVLRDRVVKCFQRVFYAHRFSSLLTVDHTRAAALATDTKVTITLQKPMYDLVQNRILGTSAYIACISHVVQFVHSPKFLGRSIRKI